MPIKMTALTSFMGVEGLIKRGTDFVVRDQARADYLERVRYARREGEAAAYQTQAVSPTNTPAVAPSHISINGPENMPQTQPENVKADKSQISAQETPEPSGGTITPGNDLDGMSYTDLKAIAKKNKISGYSSMKKDKLIEEIKKLPNGGVNNDD